MTATSVSTQQPTKVGIGIGVVGVAFVLLTTTLLIIVPQELLTPASSNEYIETWSRPIMAVGQAGLLYVIPIVGGVTAYYLARKGTSPKSVIGGFVLGGLVFIVGNALVGVAVTHVFAEGGGIDRSLLGHFTRSIAPGGRLIGGALLGVVSAIIVRNRS